LTIKHVEHTRHGKEGVLKDCRTGQELSFLGRERCRNDEI